MYKTTFCKVRIRSVGLGICWKLTQLSGTGMKTLQNSHNLSSRVQIELSEKCVAGIETNQMTYNSINYEDIRRKDRSIAWPWYAHEILSYRRVASGWDMRKHSLKAGI